MQRLQVLIVDGYNVIRNNARYSRLGPDYEGGPAWNAAREALINDAALVAAGAYEHCTVVFDGAGNPNSTGRPERVAGIDVIFSPSGVSADSVIERLSHEARERGREVTVVSSDLTIQSTVFGGGVTRMSSSGFTSLSEGFEDEWHEGGEKAKMKSTISNRIDPGVAERLEAFVRGGSL